MNHANNNTNTRGRPSSQPENLPIANLDNLQPVHAPHNKIFPLEVSNGSPDKPPQRDIPADVDVEKAVVTDEDQEKCFDPFNWFLNLINRPAFKPWLLTSICLGIFSWKVLIELAPRLQPLFGIDRERQAQALDAIFSQAHELGQQQEQCIHDGAAKCRDDYDIAHYEERAQINVIRASNQVKLEHASTVSSQCIMRLYDTEAALRDLVLSGGTPPFVDNTSVCSAKDQEELLAIAGGKVRRDQNEIMTFLRVLSDEGETQTEYLKDLAIYNRDYFLGQIAGLEADLLLDIGSLATNFTIPLPAGIDGLITCVSPDLDGLAIVPCPLIEPISVSLDRVRETAKAIIRISKEQLDLAAMAIATLVDRYDWVVGGIDDLIRIFQGIRNVLGRPFDLAFDRLGGGFDFSQFDNLPSGYFYVSRDLDFPNLPDVPPIDIILADFREEIVKVKEATREIAAQVTDEIREKVDALISKVRLGFDGILEDYDPPNAPGFSSVDLDDISDKFANTRQQAFDQIAAAINRFGTDTDTLPESEAFVPPGATIAFNATSAQVQDAKAALLPFSYPDIPGWIWRLYDFLLTKFWICDIISVLYQILRKGRKVYDESSTPIPVVHMPTTAEKKAKEEKPRWKLLVLLTHDLLPKIFTCIFGILMAVFSVFAYYTVFVDYRRGCIESTSGTYIGRVLVSNYISTPIVVAINEAQQTEAVSVESHFQNMCHDARITTALNQTQQSQHLASIMNEYNTSMIESQRLLSCIDLDAFDGVDPDLFTCTTPLDTTLEEGVASCDWGDCVIDCDQGAVTAEIQRIVIENACIIEEQYHARFWLFCVLLWAWFSLKLFSNSIHDCAPYLFPKTYGSKTVKVELERYLETGELLGSEGQEGNEALDKAIASLLLWNKLKNWCYVLIVLACNGVWITILVKLGNGTLNI